MRPAATAAGRCDWRAARVGTGNYDRGGAATVAMKQFEKFMADTRLPELNQLQRGASDELDLIGLIENQHTVSTYVPRRRLIVHLEWMMGPGFFIWAPANTCLMPPSGRFCIPHQPLLLRNRQLGEGKDHACQALPVGEEISDRDL